MVSHVIAPQRMARFSKDLSESRELLFFSAHSASTDSQAPSLRREISCAEDHPQRRSSRVEEEMAVVEELPEVVAAQEESESQSSKLLAVNQEITPT